MSNPTQTEPVPQLYSIRAVAERMDVSRDTVRRLIARDELGAIRVGGSVRVLASELTRYVDARAAIAREEHGELS